MIRTWMNYDPESAFTDVDPTSETTPDQSYTVRELFDRMSRGLSLDQSLERPTYFPKEDEDIDSPDPTQGPDFDYADYQSELESVTQGLSRASESTQKSEQSEDTAQTPETQEKA